MFGAVTGADVLPAPRAMVAIRPALLRQERRRRVHGAARAATWRATPVCCDARRFAVTPASRRFKIQGRGRGARGEGSYHAEAAPASGCISAMSEASSSSGCISAMSEAAPTSGYISAKSDAAPTSGCISVPVMSGLVLPPLFRTRIPSEAGVVSLSDVLERIVPDDWDFKFHFRDCRDEGRTCDGPWNRPCIESPRSVLFETEAELLQCLKCGIAVCCKCSHHHFFDHLDGFGREDAEISEKVIEFHKACCEVIFQRQSGRSCVAGLHA